MEMTTDTDPLRVVLFTYGARLQQDVKRFICRLDAHPEIELVAGFCQAEGQGYVAMVRDLWHRRHLLAVPLLLAQILAGAGRYLRRPDAERALDRGMARAGTRIRFVRDLHDPVVIERVRALDPALGLIYGAPLLKPALFEIPHHGTLGIHHGRLPAYRGKKTTFWAMLNGDRTAGVTIQKVNAGLDTGSIVKQGEVPIGDRWQHQVWTDLERLGIDLFIEAILEVKRGSATFRPQPAGGGRLYRDPRWNDILSLWWRQARRRFS